MAYQFLSREWVEQFVSEINNSPAYASAAQNWEGDVLLVTDGQGGVYLDLWHGTCRAAEYLDDPTTKNAEFTISTTADKWRQILIGKLDPIQAMMTGQVKIFGNMVKIMKNVRAAQELVRCAMRVETVF
jgi:putative sterol carrier protein